MSMYRQLWLALILSTLLALVGGLLMSTFSTRAYLQEQLRIKNADNASVLALSLSHAGVDAVEAELAVSALFDSGHYESIRVLDPFGKELVRRSAASMEYDAPRWFVRWLPIEAPAGKAMIIDGWKQFGEISLVSHQRFAYRALWKSTVSMAAALAFAVLLGGYLATLILRRLRRPLDAVIEQARAICERRFITIPEPDVPELRQLSAAMNAAVGRLKSMFTEEATWLDLVRREANCDPLTELANRSYFMAQLRTALELDETSAGSLMLVRVARLGAINRRFGRERTDNLLKSVGRLLQACVQRIPGSLAARLNGADFAVLLPQGDHEMIAHDLLLSLVRETAELLGDEPVAFIGIGQYHFGMDMSQLLARVDAALAEAEAGGITSVRPALLHLYKDAPRSAGEWGGLIRNALDHDWVQLACFPVSDFSGRVAHRECPLRMKFSADGEWLPASRFLPAAQHLDLTAEIDLAAVRLGLQKLAENAAVEGVAINLSARSIQDRSFRQRLRSLLVGQAEASRRLWLEVSENGALAHIDAFRAFCQELKACGCRLGLEHSGRQFSQIGVLHDLGLDYLKVDASFVHGVERSAGNQLFLRGLTGVAHNIGLLVFAEGVESGSELLTLKSLGFDGATGPAVREPDDAAQAI